MTIHCPECGFDGERNPKLINALLTFLSRLSSQTNVSCPKWGFHKAFTRDEWDRTQA